MRLCILYVRCGTSAIMSEAEVKNEKYKRKRKKSFLKNARKYAKKGCYGRGSQLDSETYQYFVRIMEAYREGFPSEEDKLVFVNNVFEQTVDQEVNCICNQVGCRVVEQLLPFSNDRVLLRYVNAISSDIRRLCSDRFASHVIEALLTQACARYLKAECEEEDRNAYFEFVMKVSKFLLNNLEDYLWDTYGNHIGRSVLTNLSQIQEDSKTSKEGIPDEFKEVVKDYAERLILWPQFKELPYTEITSAFLQTLLKALKQIDRKLLKQYLKQLLELCFLDSNVEIETDKLPPVFMSKPAMMLLETALQVAKSKMFTQYYAKCFVGHLEKLAKTRSTNFTVQKLLNHCEEKVEFEAVFDELAEHFEGILEAGHSGILFSLAQTCKRLSARQGIFVQSMMQALHCYEPSERQDSFILCIARLTPYEQVVERSNENLQAEKLNLHGTLILQVLLEFHKPIKIVNSMLNMQSEHLKSLFSNSMGSHIVDSYTKSNFVGEKSREKLIKKLQGCYQELATTKYGSRAFEALWNAASFKNKLAIIEELSRKDGTWANSEHGRIIASKVNLALYKRSKEDWKNNLNKTSKVESLLDILE